MFESLVMCLALNVYFEARNEPIAGQVAVAQVVMNRVKSSRYPNDVCRVVYDKSSRGCQFSWYCDGLSDRPYDEASWKNALLIASAVLAGSGHKELQYVTHYHATYVRPYWIKGMRQILKINNHIFYIEVI